MEVINITTSYDSERCIVICKKPHHHGDQDEEEYNIRFFSLHSYTQKASVAIKGPLLRMNEIV
jgi:hypothetical protein